MSVLISFEKFIEQIASELLFSIDYSCSDKANMKAYIKIKWKLIYYRNTMSE